MLVDIIILALLFILFSQATERDATEEAEEAEENGAFRLLQATRRALRRRRRAPR